MVVCNNSTAFTTTTKKKWLFLSFYVFDVSFSICNWLRSCNEWIMCFKTNKPNKYIMFSSNGANIIYRYLVSMNRLLIWWFFFTFFLRVFEYSFISFASFLKIVIFNLHRWMHSLPRKWTEQTTKILVNNWNKCNEENVLNALIQIYFYRILFLFSLDSCTIMLKCYK